MIEPSNDWGDYPEPLIPYVPTTQVVRDAYVRGMRNAFIASASEHQEEFERWLKGEQARAWQQGYATRLRDEAEDIGAEPHDWLPVLDLTEEEADQFHAAMRDQPAKDTDA